MTAEEFEKVKVSDTLIVGRDYKVTVKEKFGNCITYKEDGTGI